MCAHFDAGRLDHRVDMACFFRRLPPQRNFEVACEPPEAAWARAHAGIERLPEHLRGLATDHGRPFPLVVSDRLAVRIEAAVRAILDGDAAPPH